MNRVYACIDLKSFYASVECVERNLDPLTTNLVVADSERTEKTICLAVSPSLKKYGLGGRARLYEVVQKLRVANNERRKKLYGYKFSGKSYNDLELEKDKTKEIDYIVAIPRMSHYMKYSTNIYNVYLKYLSPEDIYVYSIDEVFCDITNYLSYNNMTPKEFVSMIIKDVYETTGITATGGIGSNMYLAKVAMDIVAKHTEPNEIGVRIAELNEMSYRKKLWSHKPITDFWRVGKGYQKRLEQNGIFTMGDIARCSLNNEDLLYKLFGVNAEILIDHAWGYEPCTMKDVKTYKPEFNSVGSGQVLHCPYTSEKAKLIVKEMADLLSLDLVKRNLVTNQLVLTIGYDITNLNSGYNGNITTDMYGRSIPKPSHGTININHYTSSSKLIIEKMSELFDRIIKEDLLVKRINMSANNAIDRNSIKENTIVEQFDLFTDTSKIDKKIEKEKNDEKSENDLQNVLLDIKNKYGKNAILKGMNLESGATTKDRNKQIGGHRG